MASKANICGNRTNHSARKTAIQTLLHSNIPPTEVMQISGHKNVQSLNSYAEVSEAQQHCMSVCVEEAMNSNFEISNELLQDLLNDDDDFSFQSCSKQNSVQASKPQMFRIGAKSFINCTFNGNVTVNINGPAQSPIPHVKRRRVEPSLFTESSEELLR
jgi:hypothetical protein